MSQDNVSSYPMWGDTFPRDYDVIEGDYPPAVTTPLPQKAFKVVISPLDPLFTLVDTLNKKIALDDIGIHSPEQGKNVPLYDRLVGHDKGISVRELQQTITGYRYHEDLAEHAKRMPAKNNSIAYVGLRHYFFIFACATPAIHKTSFHTNPKVGDSKVHHINGDSGSNMRMIIPSSLKSMIEAMPCGMTILYGRPSFRVKNDGRYGTLNIHVDRADHILTVHSGLSREPTPILSPLKNKLG